MDIISIFGSPSMNHLTAMNGTGFLILDCFAMIKIFEIEKFHRDFSIAYKFLKYFGLLHAGSL